MPDRIPLASFISFVAVLTIFTTVLIGEEQFPTLFQRDPITAWQQAQQQNRPILVYVTTDACVHCKKMERLTFTDQKIKSDIRRSFVPLVVKPTDGLPLVDRLKIRSYPTTAVIAPDGRVLAKISGYISVADLRLNLEKSLQGVQTAARP